MSIASNIIKSIITPIIIDIIDAGGDVPPITPWILETGAWNDEGVWDDEAIWID